MMDVGKGRHGLWTVVRNGRHAGQIWLISGALIITVSF
jgi:hypothetical protein